MATEGGDEAAAAAASFSVESIEEPVCSELRRLGVAVVSAQEYTLLPHLGGNPETIASSLSQCGSWEEAVEWATQLYAAAAAEENDGGQEVAAWQQLLDPESGRAYYQPLAEDHATPAGEWQWGASLAAWVAESLAASCNQQWVHQVDEEAGGADYYIFTGPTNAAQPHEGAPEVGTWLPEADFIASNLTVIAGDANEPAHGHDAHADTGAGAAVDARGVGGETGRAPASTAAVAKGKVKQLAERFEAPTAAQAAAAHSSSAPSPGTAPGEAGRTAARSADQRTEVAKKREEALQTALAAVPKTVLALQQLSERAARARCETEEVRREAAALERARRAAALREWEANREQTLDHTEAPITEIWSCEELAAKEFRLSGPTLKEDMVCHSAVPLVASKAVGASGPTARLRLIASSVVVLLADGRAFLYNDTPESTLRVTVYLAGEGAPRVGVNGKDSKQVDADAHRDLGALTAVETTADPNALVQMFGLHGAAAGGALPVIVAITVTLDQIPQWRALHMKAELAAAAEALVSRMAEIDRAEHGNLRCVMAALQQAGTLDYIDLRFPPLVATLGPISPDEHRVNGFRSPSMFLSASDRANITIVRGVPPACDYHGGGHLGGSAMAQAVSALATRPSRLDPVFCDTSMEHAPYGRFVVSLLRGGWWTAIPVDHFMPTSIYERCLARNAKDPAELAPSLVEKAAAKLHASRGYAGLDDAPDAALAGDMLAALTGFPARSVRMTDDRITADALCQHVQAGHVVLCTASAAEKDPCLALAPGHAHTITRAVRAGSTVLFRVRAPCADGNTRYFASGAFSGASADWPPGTANAELASMCRGVEVAEEASDCFFWASFEELWAQCALVQICEIDDRRCRYDCRVRCDMGSTLRTAADFPLGVLLYGDAAAPAALIAATLHAVPHDDAEHALALALFRVGGSHLPTLGAPLDQNPFAHATLSCVAMSLDPEGGGVAALERHSLRAVLDAGAIYVLRPVLIPRSSSTTSVPAQLDGVIAVQSDCELGAPTDEAVAAAERWRSVFVRCGNASTEVAFMSAFATAYGDASSSVASIVATNVELIADAAAFQLRTAGESVIERFGSFFSFKSPKTLPRNTFGVSEVPTNQDALASAGQGLSNARTQQCDAGVAVVFDADDVDFHCGIAPDAPASTELRTIMCDALSSCNGVVTPFADIAKKIHAACAESAVLGHGWFVTVGSAIDAAFGCHDGAFAQLTSGNVQVLAVRPTVPKLCAACGTFISSRFYNFFDRFGAYVHVTPPECLETFRLQRAPACLVCGEKVRTWGGKFYNLNQGKIHDGECWEKFRSTNARECIHCKAPLLSKWLVAADDPDIAFHEECAEGYRLSRLPDCAVCGEKIQSQFYDTAAGKIHPGECYSRYKTGTASS